MEMAPMRKMFVLTRPVVSSYLSLLSMLHCYCCLQLLSLTLHTKNDQNHNSTSGVILCTQCITSCLAMPHDLRKCSALRIRAVGKKN